MVQEDTALIVKLIEGVQSSLDGLDTKVTCHQRDNFAHFSQHDERLKSLERWRSGIVAVASAILTFFGLKSKGIL